MTILASFAPKIPIPILSKDVLCQTDIVYASTAVSTQRDLRRQRIWLAIRPIGIVANDNLEAIYAMRISILALEGLWDTGLTVILDAFKLANGFSAAQMGGAPHFDVSIAGVRRRVRSGQGF